MLCELFRMWKVWKTNKESPEIDGNTKFTVKLHHHNHEKLLL